MSYMQKTHLYSLIQTAFCIFVVISGYYFRVPSLKPNLRLMYIYWFCGDLARRGWGYTTMWWFGGVDWKCRCFETL